MKRLAIVAAWLIAAAPPALRAQTPLDHLAQGNYADARHALAAQVAGRPDAPLHGAFLEGLILSRQGQRDAAIRLYRKILSAEPRFEPARRELTALLAGAGQTGAAIYHAERLMATTQDDRYKAELGAFIARAVQGKPRGIVTRFAVLPSSNANGGTDSAEVDIGGLAFVPDPASRAQRAVGISFGATAWNRWQLSERSALTASVSVDTRRYNHAHVADESTLGLRLDLTQLGPRHRLTFGPRAELTYNSQDGHVRRLGFGVSGQMQLRPDLTLGGSLAVYRQEYDPLSYRDGQLITGSLVATWIAAPDLTLSLGLPFTVERTRSPHLDHRDIGLSLGVEKTWRNGLTTGVSVSQSRNRYDGAYPLFGAPRKDRITTLGLSFRHRDLRVGAFVPELTITGTDASSNIPFHDYRKIDVGISLTQRF